ncbi:MAG: DUF932 domain-containing protein [Mycolicibacterium sp.]|uniref:DUF932 domain-containing protein n=1 Tax=Mycolicibacterium sp. TaxID=2320850 RepID=UPI003D11396E
MAHNLDITNGIASFAAREDAWHHLGQYVGHAMTAREALQAANLAGWNVRKMPLVIPAPTNPDGTPNGTPIPVTDRYATVRTNPVTGATDYLGVVGEKYTPFQNEKSCELLDALVGESGAHFETAGALDGGRQTFVTMQLPTSMVFDGKDGTADETRWYIAALNSHDGSSAYRFLVSPVRIVCANTQAAALRNAKASFSIRHTGSGNGLIAAARNALKLTFAYVAQFEEEAAALFAAEMSDDQAHQFATTLFDVGGATSRAAITKRREHARAVYNLFRSSPTTTAITGTRWAAYNAVTEYVDHHQRVSGARTSRAAQDTRAIRTLTSSTTQGLKINAFSALQTL